MRLEQTNTVDFLGVERETGVVIATLVDDADWDDEMQHLRLLQAKINRYFDFIESGEIFSELARTTGRAVSSNHPVKLSILGKHPPRGEGERFLEHVAGIAREAGIQFAYKIVGEHAGT
jgi:hypothetical protein